MATDDDPKLRLQLLCGTCRGELHASMTRLHDHAHFDVEVLIEPCETCVMIPEPDSPTAKPVELILNDRERCEVRIDYVR